MAGRGRREGADARRRAGLLPPGPGRGDADRLLPRQPVPRRGLAPFHGARRPLDRDRHARLGALGPGPERFDYSMYGLSAFLERCLDELGVAERKLVVHDWGALGADRRPAAPGAGREAGDHQRGAAHRPATAGTGSPATSGAGAAVGEVFNRLTSRSGIALLMRQATRRPRAACRPSSSTWSGTAGTRAPGARSWPSTARRPRPARQRPARTSAGSSARRSSLWGERDPYLSTEFAQAYADAPAELRDGPRPGRRPLALDRRRPSRRSRRRFPRLEPENRAFRAVNPAITIVRCLGP